MYILEIYIKLSYKIAKNVWGQTCLVTIEKVGSVSFSLENGTRAFFEIKHWCLLI